MYELAPHPAHDDEANPLPGGWPADLLARRAAALAGAAAVLLPRGGWLAPVAALPAAAVGVGPLSLADPALAALAPIRALAERSVVAGPPIRSAVWPLLGRAHTAYPLLHDDQAVGVLLVAAEAAEPGAREALADLAALGGAALAPKRLAGADHLAALQQIARAVATAPTRLDALARALAEALGVRAAAILLPDEARRPAVHGVFGLRPEEMSRLAPGGPLTDDCQWVILHAEPRLAAPPRATRADAARLVGLVGAPPALLAPMMANGRVLGVLALLDPPGDRRFGEADVRLALSAGLLVGSAIEAGAAARAGREAADRLDALTDASADGVIVVDDRQVVVRANTAARAALRLPAEAAGMPLATVLRDVRVTHPDGTPATLDDLPLLRVLRLGQPIADDLRFQPPGGAARRYRCQATPLRDSAGRVVGAVTFDRDVTIERQATRLTEAIEALSETAADPTPDGVAARAVEQAARLLDVDAAILWLVDPSVEVLRRLASHGLPAGAEEPESLPLDAATPAARAARTSTIQVVEEVPPDAGVAEPRPAGVAGALFAPLIVGQRPIGVIAALARQPRRFHDTEVAAMQALAVQVAMLLDYARLAADAGDRQRRDDFVSIASHELKTPLTSIRGYAELIARRLVRDGQGEHHQRALTIITQQIDRMARLVNDLLDLSRYEAGSLSMEPELLDLADFVGRVVERQRAAAARHQVVTDLPARPTFVHADPARLEQALGHLLSNAAKYSPEGSVVTMRLTTTRAEAVITVEDQGIGIPPERQAQLFERYHRAPGAAGAGLGIGLFIARQIAVRHGGRIWVDSAPGQGSAFSLALPLADD